MALFIYINLVVIRKTTYCLGQNNGSSFLILRIPKEGSLYIVDSGYFKKVTRNTCVAGGFIFHTNYSHVIFVVANDTVTMQFSSHTADREHELCRELIQKFYYYNSAKQNYICYKIIYYELFLSRKIY